MRKPHKIIVLVCALFFIGTIALNLPFSINEFATPTSTNLTTNLTDLEQQLLHPTATKLRAIHCYPFSISVPRSTFLSCSLAIWEMPRDEATILFNPRDFPIRYKYQECSVTLTLQKPDLGSWYGVHVAAANFWYACHEKHPDTLQGATGVAGHDGRIFIRIWFERAGNVTDDGVTAREISEGGIERDSEGGGLSYEG